MTLNFFISSIYDNDIYLKTPNVSYKGLFDYYENKEEIIKYNIVDIGNNEEFEIIDKEGETHDIEKKELREGLIKGFEEERQRTKRVIEYLIVNIDVNKLELPYYKSYDYNDVPKYMKTKIKKHTNLFDIKVFMSKNKINKEYLINLFDLKDNNLSVNKLCIYHILYKIIELYNLYNKALIYSIELLKKYPNLLDEDKYLDYLVKINPNHFVIKNDEINILHVNEIKNAYLRKEEKTQMSIQSSSTILFHKQDKIHKILFI
jgi:hypothetical protein